jgi:hypothetical protein
VGYKWDAKVKHQIRHASNSGAAHNLFPSISFSNFFFSPQAGRSISKITSPSNESHVRLRISGQTREGDHWSASTLVFLGPW